MVGKRRQCHIDHTTKEIWKNIDHEYGRAVLFELNAPASKICLKGPGNLGDKGVSGDSGYLSRIISLSFANLKEPSYELTRQKVCDQLQQLYTEHAYILESGILKGVDKSFFERTFHNEKVEYVDATLALYKLSSFMYQYYGKKVLILLDQ